LQNLLTYKIHIKLLLLLIFIVIGKFSFAQNMGSIAGNLTDKGKPIEFVNVVLRKTIDSTKVVAYANTDSLGQFKFSNIPFNEYQIKFSFIGYQSFSQIISLNAKTNFIELKNVELKNNGTTLNTITVTAQKKSIEKTSEGFIVNAASNITQAGGTATDLLKNTPTVSVDADGTITLRGKTPLILINGRTSTLTNPNNIPASSIESIEIINSATAKYDANAESGIINIKLKKNKQNGTSGAGVLGMGAGAKGRVNSSFLLNHKTKKWNLGIEYDNRFAGRTRTINGSRTNYFVDTNYLINQNRNDNRLEQLQSLKFNADFSPNEKNSFSFEAIGNSEGQDNHETLGSMIYNKNQMFNSNTSRHSDEFERDKAVEFSLDYSRKFKDDKKSLTANISTSLNFDRENTDITSQPLTENYNSIGNPFLERTHNYEDEKNTNAKLDYAVPLSKIALLETGYKGIFRSIIANYEASQNINNAYVINTAASNVFNFVENVQAVYALYSSSFGNNETPKWKYNVGIRGEQVSNNGYTQNNSTHFSNQYLKIFPTGSITFNNSATENIKLSYGKRINRPNLGQLNPFTDLTDSLNPHSGNPYLKPEIIHAIELGYANEWKKISFSINLFYRYSINTIRPFYQLQANGVNLNLPMNIGNSSTFGFENMVNAKLNTAYEVNASFSLFQQHLNGSNISSDVVQDALGWYGKIINNFVPVKNGKLQIIANYNSALATPQGKRIEQYFMDLGYQQKFGKGNIRLGLTVVDVFNNLKSGYINNTSLFTNYRYGKADTRAIMVTFAYTFKSVFKEKLLDNQFSKEY